MTIKTLARGLTLFVALAVALTVMAVPAVAAEPNAIASIASGQRTVIAGTPEAPFSITVTNVPDPTLGPTSTAPNIKQIRITPPDLYFTPLFVGQLPNGWTGTIDPVNKSFVLFGSANPIQPGQSLTFTVATSVFRTEIDVTRQWLVQVSGDGQTYKKATADPQPSTSSPTGTGTAALETTIKVLQVLATKLSAPAGVVDGTVTNGQTTDVTLDITNHGSGTLAVTPNITFSVPNGSVASATLIRSATCPDNSAAFPARQMGPQSTTSFVCQVRFTRNNSETAGSGNISMTGRADGRRPGGSSVVATALTSGQGVVVMTSAVFSYIDDSLQPTDVSPGRAFIFRLSLRKTGQVAVNLDKANTTLSFGPPESPTLFTATLNEPAVVPAGGTSTTPLNVTLEFRSTTVPASMPADDGTGKREYDPVLTVSGADENDFAVSTQPNIIDNILVDALGPIIELDRPLPPPSRVVDDPNRTDDDPAATNNVLVSFSGTIRDRGATCGACPIVSAVIKQFDANQVPIPGADIPVTISNNNGTLSGTYDKTYHPAALYMALEVVGADPGMNTTRTQSLLLDVDNVLPSVLSAITGTDVQADESGERRVNRLIMVDVSEPLAGAVTAADWTVDGHRVVAAEPYKEGSPATRGNFTQVRLTVDPELGRNEETNVTYAPAGARANDRVGLLLPNRTVLAVDGIVPRLPEVLTISGMEKQEDDNGDERFYTNDSTPDISVEIDGGDTVVIYDDVNGNGEIDEGVDREVCRRKADSNETVVTCTSSTGFGTTDRDTQVLLRSFDTRLNVGPTAVEPLTLDFTRPVISAVTVLANDLEVTFSETLSELWGRNDVDDWYVEVRDGPASPRYNPARVEGEGRKRTLRNDNLWGQQGQELVQVLYVLSTLDPAGTPERARYADRAGNVVLDQTFAIPA